MPKRVRRVTKPEPLVLCASRRRSLQAALVGLVIALIASAFLYVAVVVHSLEMVQSGFLALVFLLGSLFVFVVGIVASLKSRTVTVDDRGFASI